MERRSFDYVDRDHAIHFAQHDTVLFVTQADKSLIFRWNHRVATNLSRT